MKKFDAKSWLKTLPRTLNDPVRRRLIYEEPKEAIRTWVEKARTHSLNFDITILTKVEQVSGWYSLQGCFDLLQADNSGWQAIQSGFHYHAWSRRIIAGFKDANRYHGPISLCEVTNLLAHSMAIGEDAFADWLGRDILASFGAKDDKYGGWDYAPFHPFIVKLFAHWRHLPLEYPNGIDSVMGVYKEVFESWNSTDFGKVLSKACDYHCAHNEDRGRDDDSFPATPYDLFPAEILAIQRVRGEHGLRPVEIKHPLMQTPLARLPERVPEVSDELLDEVAARARAEFAIGNPW